MLNLRRPFAWVDWLSAQEKMKLANSPETDGRVLSKLRKDENRIVQEAVARNPGTPETVLRKMTGKGSRLNDAVAENPNASTKILRYLSKDHSQFVLQSVASNENAPKDVLIHLSYSSYLWVRVAVAENKKTPPSVLDDLSRDRVEEVRIKVALNHSTSSTTLFNLAEEGGYVREAVMENPNYDFNRFVDDFLEVD